MKKLSLLLAVTLVPAVSLFAGEAKLSPRKAQAPVVRSESVRVTESARVVNVERSPLVNARPCGSTACRPVRFAWSPTAPGS